MIRLAEAADAESIGHLWAEMVAYHAALDPETFRPAERGAERYARGILDRLRDADARVLVAEIDGAVVGYVNGVVADITTELFIPLRCGLLADIYLQAAFRRRGLGKQLVERLMLWFRSRGVNHIEWHVSARNHEALAFWKAVGGETTMLRMRATIPEVD
ncbi:MAG: GNAT family N-acetyltransferase [Chloroflexi bacterium]|nr:GNAT family N-acetyltransferase [Chloroflexota bacterium]